MNEIPDPLDALLRPISPSSSSPVWKGALLARTSRTLRWRRRGRRLSIAAGLAACYAAGLFSMLLLQAEPRIVVHEKIVYRPAETKSETQPQRETPTTPERPLTALALEWQAAENPDRSVELYRRAGDRYFDAENDLVSAVRCYKRFLSECKAEELQIDPNDNWLLVTLKNARLEERRRANTNS